MTNEQLIKAANSENGKIIVEHLKERIVELDLNEVAEAADVEEMLPSKLKAVALARKILKNEIRLLSGEFKEADSILNYLD